MRKKGSTLRKRAARKVYKNKRAISYKKIVKKIVLLFIAIFVFTVILVLFKPGRWSSDARFVLASTTTDGHARVTVFDPEGGVVNILIDKNTQVEAARQMGVWKLESIWPLGEQEGESGEFFADTIQKTFYIPVDGWAGEGLGGILVGNLASGTKALFTPIRTNLSFRDKLKIFFLTLSTPAKDQENITLSQTSYLEKAKLPDATEGFIVRKDMPTKLVRLFAHPSFTSPNFRIGIVDTVGSSTAVVHTAKVIEVLGAKVVSVERSEEKQPKCALRGNSKSVLKELNRVFGCQIAKEAPKGNLDVEIYIGEDFIRAL